MNFQFDFTLEDANLEQADALLETICTWADHRNCRVAGGFHRLEPGVAAEPPRQEVPHAPARDVG